MDVLELIGLSEYEAIEKLSKNNYLIRIISKDGNVYRLNSRGCCGVKKETTNPRRVNLRINKAIITDAYIG